MLNFVKDSYSYKTVPNSKWILVFVHWLTSSKDEEIFVHWESFFNENGYSTIRFNQYWDFPWERKLEEVTLQDNIDDVNKVIDFCISENHKNIYLVWHSYWWLVNLYVKHDNITSILMRDSSIAWEGLLEDVYKDENGKHYIDWWSGYRFYIGEWLYKDFLRPSEEYLEKIATIHLPIKVITAEYWLAKAGERYYNAITTDKKEFVIIPWAYHRFDEGWMDKLFMESLNWIENLN